MKKIVLFIVVSILMTSLAFAETKVSRIALTTGIENKEPVDTITQTGTNFTTVYCFTEIQTNEYPTEVTHIWIHDKSIEAEVKLNIGSPKWRTHSSKIIVPEKSGDWKVEVYANNGKLIDSIEFTANGN